MFPTRRFSSTVDSDQVGTHSWCSSSDSSSLSTPSSSSFLVYPSCSYTPSTSGSDLSELAASFQSDLAIDIEAFGRDALGRQHVRPDLAQVRQDFVRNGIDSAVPGLSGVRRRPPGFTLEPVSCPKWPLNALENIQTSTPVEHPMVFAEKPEGGSRNRRRHKENEDYCVFCYNNGEHQEVYLSHVCRDERGQVQCPRLRRYVCPYCRATDRNAHTKKYCPNKPIITPDDLLKMPAAALGEDLPMTAPAPVPKSKSKRSLRF